MCLILCCFKIPPFLLYFCLVSGSCFFIITAVFLTFVAFFFVFQIIYKNKSNSFSFCKSSRGIRPDVSLVPPIRQTASIFKQPVTVHRNHDSKVKSDLKHGTSQEKPKQLFWEKRLEVKIQIWISLWFWEKKHGVLFIFFRFFLRVYMLAIWKAMNLVQSICHVA